MYVDIFFQYSILKRKLYINQNRFVNVEFRIDDKKRIQKQMLFVRALCIFKGSRIISIQHLEGIQ